MAANTVETKKTSNGLSKQTGSKDFITERWHQQAREIQKFGDVVKDLPHPVKATFDLDRVTCATPLAKIRERDAFTVPDHQAEQDRRWLINELRRATGLLRDRDTAGSDEWEARRAAFEYVVKLVDRGVFGTPAARALATADGLHKTG